MGEPPKAWTVDFDSEAVIDFEDVKSRGDRRAVFNVVQKLKDLGPDLPSPHMKSLKGEANLFELRPKQGACEARPIYARFGSRFVILAVAAKKKNFDRAIMDTSDRLKRHSGLR
ncbi:MAG TPA: type II toxin-antitoxin system RelE/ParE family toxin [Solirubrobacterales bacterium]|nr:type II toxin-antitoxin system RelE/ParE family toxin [Solirubrobacterales bacterium]